MSDAEQSYHFLLEKELKPEDARKILPNSTATHIVMKANIREWRHIFSLRLGKGVYPENARTDGSSVEGSQGKNPRGVRRSGGARMMTLGSLFSGSGPLNWPGA